MGSGITLLLWTAQLPSPFLFLYHRYVSILKYNTAGVCLAIKKAMPEDRWITGFPFMVPDALRFTANDKDVSLALEMTTQESAVPHSLEAPNPQPLIPSY